MIASNLPSPGTLRLSQKLRTLCAQAIGYAEARGQNGGSSPELLAFFNACAAAVTAAAPVPPLTGINATPATASIVVGQTQQITTAAVPSGATLPARTYATSAAGVATVSASGLVTAVAAGTATITVTAGSFTDTAAVTVTAA